MFFISNLPLKDVIFILSAIKLAAFMEIVNPSTEKFLILRNFELMKKGQLMHLMFSEFSVTGRYA
jgi:hypothetical protein